MSVQNARQHYVMYLYREYMQISGVNERSLEKKQNGTEKYSSSNEMSRREYVLCELRHAVSIDN